MHGRGGRVITPKTRLCGTDNVAIMKVRRQVFEHVLFIHL